MRDEFGITIDGDAQDGERRNALRRKQIRGAKIVYNNGHSLLDCAIRDLSETGARLTIDTLVELPEHFSLLFQDGRKRPVQVACRRSHAIGIRFLDVPEDAPLARGSSEPALLERVERIEEELARLRAELTAATRD